MRVCSQNYSYALEGVDGVVVAAGRNPQDRLSAWAKEHLPGTRVFVIGDAGRPGVALDAIHQGAAWRRRYDENGG